MAKQVKVATPNKPTPQPVTPTSPKPGGVKPAKAHAHGTTCARCNKHPPTIRAICSTCDYELQKMHWSIEYALFRKVTYMPDPAEAKWFSAEENYGTAMRKPPTPTYRKVNAPRHEAAMIL